MSAGSSVPREAQATPSTSTVDGQDQGKGSMLDYSNLSENQRNLFDTVVKEMKLEYRESLRKIFNANYSEDLNTVLSPKLCKDGNVFSILTYCFYG